MAEDAHRAERIRDLKEGRPGLKWRQIADAAGVSERSALAWAQTGAISYENAEKVATFFGVDADWVYSGRDDSVPDLMQKLDGGRSQLDRIEEKLDELLRLQRDEDAGDAIERELAEAAAQVLQHSESTARTSRAKRQAG